MRSTYQEVYQPYIAAVNDLTGAGDINCGAKLVGLCSDNQGLATWAQR